jgi:hypothetical protein
MRKIRSRQPEKFEQPRRDILSPVTTAGYGLFYRLEGAPPTGRYSSVHILLCS